MDISWTKVIIIFAVAIPLMFLVRQFGDKLFEMKMEALKKEQEKSKKIDKK